MKYKQFEQEDIVDICVSLHVHNTLANIFKRMI